MSARCYDCNGTLELDDVNSTCICFFPQTGLRKSLIYCGETEPEDVPEMIAAAEMEYLLLNGRPDPYPDYANWRRQQNKA